MALLDDAANPNLRKVCKIGMICHWQLIFFSQRAHIVETEPFSEIFGPKAQRKRPRLEVGSFEELGKAGTTAAEEAKNVAGEGMILIHLLIFIHVKSHPQNPGRQPRLSQKHMLIILNPSMPRAHLVEYMENSIKSSTPRMLFCMLLMPEIHWAPCVNRYWSILKKKKLINRSC